jgi:hypothetical protein
MRLIHVYRDEKNSDHIDLRYQIVDALSFIFLFVPFELMINSYWNTKDKKNLRPELKKVRGEMGGIPRHETKELELYKDFSQFKVKKMKNVHFNDINDILANDYDRENPLTMKKAKSEYDQENSRMKKTLIQF